MVVLHRDSNLRERLDMPEWQMLRVLLRDELSLGLQLSRRPSVQRITLHSFRAQLLLEFPMLFKRGLLRLALPKKVPRRSDLPRQLKLPLQLVQHSQEVFVPPINRRPLSCGHLPLRKLLRPPHSSLHAPQGTIPSLHGSHRVRRRALLPPDHLFLRSKGPLRSQLHGFLLLRLPRGHQHVRDPWLKVHRQHLPVPYCRLRV